ncbi:MAG: AAA family ATPase [archaeon]
MANPKNTISTGRGWLDDVLRGGLPSAGLSLVYGEASTGKTTLAMHCAIEIARDDAKTLFIDSDDSFSLERLFQMIGNQDHHIADNIMLVSPVSFHEQTQLIENLENYVTRRLRLIVVDSITSLYSASLASSETTFLQNRQLNRQFAYLAELAPRKGLAILVTGHVHAKPASESRVELVSRRLLTHWPNVILRLSRTQQSGLNVAFLEKYFNSEAPPGTCFYRISSEGLSKVEIEGQ